MDLETFFIERNLSQKTIKQYNTAWKQYCEYNNGLTVEQLLNEADEEEEAGVRLKKRTLKTRLVGFRTHLIENNNSKNSIINKMNQIKAVYRHYEIEIPQLPYLSDKNLKKQVPITYADLPDKTIIREALDFAPQMVRAFILLQVSSGMGRAEVLSLDLESFLSSSGFLDKTKSIREQLINMYKCKELIIPTFKLKRQKVNEYYYTFCSPEATIEIVRYLLNRGDDLKYESPLFKVGPNYINELYAQINDVLGLGKVGDSGYNRFRTHMLRKFNATALTTGDNALSEAEVDFLQGRSRGKVRETYMKKDSKILKEKYINAMSNVLINHTSSVVNTQLREFERNEAKFNKLLELLSVIDIKSEELDI